MKKSKNESQLTPRKTPRQRRSAATVDTIIEAATRVLASESLAGFNTNRVAEVAGVSVGSLYQYFPNKAALVATLIEIDHAQLSVQIATATKRHENSSFETALKSLIDVAIAHQFDRPLLAAALDHEELRLPMQHVNTATEITVAASIQKLLDKFKHQIDPISSQSAAVDCLIITKALIEAEMGGQPKANLKRRVFRAITGYLGYKENRPANHAT
jgi:AcrR family transcriptional regulator